jgi:hypothetical protein
MNITKEPVDIFSIDLNGQIKLNNEDSFSLLPNSRVSFIGCWLVMLNQDHAENDLGTKELPNKGHKKSLKHYKFIFKDSLSHQDYSRLRRIISTLKHASQVTM